MAGFGLIILGSSQHLWFNYVGRVLPKRDVITTFKKLAMGQLMYGPIINSVFFSFNAALQGILLVIRLKLENVILNYLTANIFHVMLSVLNYSYHTHREMLYHCAYAYRKSTSYGAPI